MTGEYVLRIMEEFPDATLTSQKISATRVDAAHIKWRLDFHFANQLCVAFGKNLEELERTIKWRIAGQIDAHESAAETAKRLESS